jgi:hypothetical protein
MISPDQIIRADDFIDSTEVDPTPANDNGRVPKLERNRKIDADFISGSYQFTANEDIDALTPVGIGENGNISLAALFTSTTKSGKPSNLSVPYDMVAIDTNKFVFAYGSGNFLYLAVATLDVDARSLTFGSQATVSTNIETNGHGSIGICKIDTDKFVVCYVNDGDNVGRVKVGTVSGTTITLSTTQGLGGSGVIRGNCCQLDTDKFAYAFGSDSTGKIAGFATVSGTTTTVVDSSTSAFSGILNNYGTINIDKIATDKFAITASNSSNVAIGTTASSTFVAGTPQSVGGTGTTGIASAVDDTLFIRRTNAVRYYTVSGTVLTLVDTYTTTNDSASALISDGTNVYDATNTTDDGLSGIYILGISGSTITRKKIQDGTFSTTGVRFAFDGTSYLAYSNGDFHIKGMSGGFIGFTEEAVTSGNTVYVICSGKIDNFTGLIPGAVYEASGGTIAETTTTTLPYNVTALSSTEILLQ